MQSVFSNHNETKLEINNRKMIGKTRHLETNTVLNNPLVIEEVLKEVEKTYWSEWKWKYGISKFGTQQKQGKKGKIGSTKSIC